MCVCDMVYMHDAYVAVSMCLLYTYMCISASVCEYVCLCVCACVCVCVHVCVCV